MQALAEKTLGSFLSDFVLTGSIGLLLFWLVGPIAPVSSGDLPLPIPATAGSIAYTNWVLVAILAYALGELCIEGGLLLIDVVISGSQLLPWLSLISQAHVSEKSKLAEEFARYRNRYEVICGIIGASLLGILTLLISTISPANRNLNIALSFQLSSVLLIISSLCALMMIYRMNKALS